MSTQTYYEDYWSSGGFQPLSGVHPTFERLVTPNLSGRCLDFGCGDGRSKSAWLDDRCEAYVGVDISSTAVASAKALGFDAVLIDGELPFPDASFDCAVCFDVLEHAFAPHEISYDIRRVLRPGGRLIASVPNVGYWRRRVDSLVGRWNPTGDHLAVEQPWRDPHIRFFTAAALARMLRAAEFTDVEVRGYGGALIRDIPIVRRLSDRPSSHYRRVESALPSVFAHSLMVVASR